ncbi:MAG: hypothetical protein QM758_09530 [Armatimonas sp.]
MMRLKAATVVCLFLAGGAHAQGGLALALPTSLQAPAAALLEQAQQTARLIEDPDAAGPAWAEIAQAQALAGDVAGAKRLVGQVKDDAWKAEILKAVALAQIRRADLTGAMATATGIGEDDAKAEVFLEVAVAQIRAGEVPRARQSLAAAKSALTSEYLGGLAPKIACVRAAVGDVPGAQKAVAATSGEIDRALANCELVLGAAMGGNPTLARQYLPTAQRQVDILAEGAVRSRAQVRLAAALAELGDIPQAQAVTEKIADARNRTEAYLELAERGPKTTRRDAYRRAWAAAEGILQSVTRAVVWCRIGTAASACGENEDANELLRRSREAAEALSDPREKVRALAAVLRAAPSGLGTPGAPVVTRSIQPHTSELSASFRTLALSGLRSPRPTHSLPTGVDRPRALVEAALGLLTQVEPLASGRQADATRLKASIKSGLESLSDAMAAGDVPATERELTGLIGTTTDPSSLLAELADRLAMEPGQVDSLEEERSYNAFQILKECLTALRPLPKTADTARTRVATALLDVRLAMGAASFGPAERESVYLTLPSGKLSIAEVLTRVDTWLTSEDRAGIEHLAALVSETAQKLADDSMLPERVRHPKILLALGTLSERLDTAKQP